ncbi:MAG: mechanosensitive ion channel [Planctomycetes bacterium]|nr:mechanosensitive ion channel [Planctomycetota bacterium]
MWDEEVWRTMWHNIVLFLPRLGTGLLIFVLFWLAAKALQRGVERLIRVPRFDPSLTRYLGSAARIALLLFGTVTALGTMGVDVSALVAGLGLTGFALGFALKDIVSNALSGILVLAYRPFRILDSIKVTDLEGTVTEINLRYTVLEAEGKTILIPNSSLFTNPVTVLRKGPDLPEPPEPPSAG